MPLRPQIARCSTTPCLYHEMFEAMSDILYVRDLAGVILDINPAGIRFFGRPKSDIVGKTLHRDSNDDRAISLMESNLALLESGGDRSVVELTSARGTRHAFETTTAVIRDRASGHAIGAFGIMREIQRPSAATAHAATGPLSPGEMPTTKAPSSPSLPPATIDDAEISDWLPADEEPRESR